MFPTTSAIELDCLSFCFNFVRELMGKLKLHYQVLHLLFLFLYAPFQVNSTLKCHPNQSLALLQFKSTTSFNCGLSKMFCGIYHPKQESWLENRDCCSWDGVTCDEVTGNVIGLDLSCSCIEATINRNSSLFHLSHLQWLNLAYNNFGGSQFSSEFGRLRELTCLKLSTSRFSGPIPSEISHLSKLVLLDISHGSRLFLGQQTFVLLVQKLTRLRVLHLDGVRMSSVTTDSLSNLSSSFMYLSLSATGIEGKIPADFYRLPNLHTLDFSSNYGLTGFLPESNWSSPLTILDLSATSFKGQIPYSIGNLKLLERLSIADCYFTGPIPASIGNLTRLTDLFFERNALTGQVPSSLSKLEQLTHLDLSSNSFAGQIPDFGNLSKLNEFYLFLNNFSGPLPYHLSRLSHLTDLNFGHNFFSGKIPSGLFSLPSLVSLRLENNTFSGPIDQFEPSDSLEEVILRNNKINGSIPTSIFQLTNLTFLDLSSNNFSGSIQFHMLSRLKNLKRLYLSYNSLLSISFDNNMNYNLTNLTIFKMSSCNIIGEFPSCLSTSENLDLLDLSNNKILGGILKPVSKGWNTLSYLNISNNLLTYIEQHPWKNIHHLDLSNNLLQGSVLVPPSTTVVFLVSNNKLTGTIPSSFCNLTYLRIISLSKNNLSGKIPPCLGRIKLSVLHLQKNNLHGTIPETFAKQSLMRSLDVNDNMLEGPLPISLVNCSQLEVINVGNNKISDIFPYWLGTLPVLKVLVLRSNRFYGPIHGYSETINPFSELRIIDLSHNEFTGSLPRILFENLGKMINVSKNVCHETIAELKIYFCHEDAIRYLGGAYYSDSVIVKMKGGEIEIKRIITIFTSIDMSHNHFQGEIPDALGNFKSLIVLNLDHNNLIGSIPSSLGNSTALESLDLSSNKLEGKIPMQLKSLTFLSSLNLSYNHLWGSIPQGGQFSTYEIDSFIGNKGLCGNPLQEKCSNDRERRAASAVSHGEDDTTWEFDWKIVMMGYGCGLVIGLSIGYTVFSLGKPQWLVRIVEGGRRKNIRRSRQRCGS